MAARRSAALVALLAALAVDAAGVPRGKAARRVAWDVTPIGSLPLECIHQVPSGAHASELPSMRYGVKLPNGHTFAVPVCNMKQLNRTRFHASERGPEWSKWQAAAQAQSIDLDGYDKLEATIRAPNMPQQAAAPLQIVAATQNQPFMPLFNESRQRPTGPYNVFGAVVRFPASVQGWGVSLWFATWTSGAVFTTERALHPGQHADLVVQRVGARTWKARVTVRESGEFLELAMTNPRLQLQPWASVSLSGGHLTSCRQLPRGLIDVSGIRLLNDHRDDLGSWLTAASPDWKGCRLVADSKGARSVALGVPAGMY